MIKEKKLPSFPSMRKQYFVANGDEGEEGEETRSVTENDVLTTCKAVTLRRGQRIIVVFFPQ